LKSNFPTMIITLHKNSESSPRTYTADGTVVYFPIVESHIV